MSKEIIVIENLVKTFKKGKFRVLDQVNLTVFEGEALGVIGPNGAGKTTLTGCLMGFLKPDSGKAQIAGMPADYIDVRRMVGFIPERLAFERWMTAREFMDFQAGLAGLKCDKNKIEELLELVGLNEESRNRSIRTYSRGMLQRLGLAQALVADPKILILDEPSSGIDPGGVIAMRKLLTTLKERQITILLNSHQLDQVERICDRVAFMRAGKVLCVENLDERVENPRSVSIRWQFEEDVEPDETRLKNIAESLSCKFLKKTKGEARFYILNDAQAAGLIEAMVSSGVRIIEAVNETGRLEGLFEDEAR